MTILMLAPTGNMSFGSAPSGATYVANSYGLIQITNNSAADQAYLQSAGCFVLTPFGGAGSFGFTTLANLYAADTGTIFQGWTGYPQYSAAQVFSDGANTGVWAKTGTGSGSGNWTQVSTVTFANVA